MFKPLASMLLQIVVVLLAAPLLSGIIKKMKAMIQHRKGAPILQLYFDLFKLFRKDVVISETASWIFTAAPYIYFVSVLGAIIFVPVIPQLFSYSFFGDAILVVYLLALSRFFLTLAALDTGSTFGGMGSSREMVISSLMEPSLIIVVFTLAASPRVQSTGFQAMYEGSAELGSGIISPVYLLLLAAVVIVLIAETARIPVDDPATHLELTMVHEAMILEYSGRYLALMEYGSALKQLLFISIIVNIFMPFGLGGGIIVTLLLYLLKICIVAVVVGLIEINTVKFRLFSVPNLAAMSLMLALLGFMSGFIFGR